MTIELRIEFFLHALNIMFFIHSEFGGKSGLQEMLLVWHIITLVVITVTTKVNLNCKLSDRSILPFLLDNSYRRGGDCNHGMGDSLAF